MKSWNISGSTEVEGSQAWGRIRRGQTNPIKAGSVTDSGMVAYRAVVSGPPMGRILPEVSALIAITRCRQGEAFGPC